MEKADSFLAVAVILLCVMVLSPPLTASTQPGGPPVPDAGNIPPPGSFFPDGQDRGPGSAGASVDGGAAGPGTDDTVLTRPPPPITPGVRYFYEPFPMEPGSGVFQIGGSFSLLPHPDAEQEVPIPAVDFQYKRGLFDNVSVVGTFSTVYFSNLIHAGIQWNMHHNRFSWGLANHLGLAYGFITRENLFDNVEGYAWVDMMILRLGFRFDEFVCSCSFVATYIMNSRSFVNGIQAPPGPQNTMNDYYCTLVVEQPFLKSLQLSIGMSLGYARTPYQTWMLYSTVDEWLFVPEFFFAVQL